MRMLYCARVTNSGHGNDRIALWKAFLPLVFEDRKRHEAQAHSDRASLFASQGVDEDLVTENMSNCAEKYW